MKKMGIVKMICLLGTAALFFTGCEKDSEVKISEKQVESTSSPKTDASEENLSGRDFTVAASNIIHPEDYKRIEDISSENDYAISSDLEEMQSVSDEIVEGKIESVEYVVVDGDAWTKLDISILSAMEGELVKGDKITLYQPGGYVSLEEHIEFYDDAFRYEDWSQKKIQNTVFHEVVDGEENPVAGTVSIFYLSKLTKDVFPKGTYSRVCGKYAQLEKVAGSKYRHYEMAGTKEYRDIKLSEIKENIR